MKIYTGLSLLIGETAFVVGSCTKQKFVLKRSYAFYDKDDGNLNEKEYEITKKSTSIGKLSAKSDLSFPKDPKMADRHGTFSKTKYGFVYSDFKPKTHTTYKRINSGSETELKEGMVV